LCIDLNCCNNEDELICMMAQIHSDSLRYYNSSNERKTIVILLDHVLDCTLGIDILTNLKGYESKFDLKIIWVLVSSTEDKDTVKS